MDSESTHSSALNILGIVLEPIVRLMLMVGVTWKEFCEVAKAKFVAAATEEYGIRGRPTNASRVAILTGIDRREVRRLRSQADEAPAKGYQSRASQLLSAWHHEPDFLDADGQPATLAIEGDGNTFTELMRRVAPGLPVVAMIKELKGAGAIEELPDGHLRPLNRTYVPVGTSAERLRLWTSAISDFSNTIEHNFARDEDEPARFERRALSLCIDRNALPEFRQLLEAEGQALLERIDDWLSAHELPDADSEDAIRLGVGIYHVQDRTSGRFTRKQQGSRKSPGESL